MPQTIGISEDMLKRRIVVGMADDPNKVCRMVGLFPMSAEQQEREEHEAQVRLSELGRTLPLIGDISSWVAEATTALQMEGAGEELDSPFALQFRDMIETVIAVALSTATANLVDLGYLRVGE